MNRDQLRMALGKAVERHARTLQDQGGRAGSGLLDDLERIADQHAVEHAGKVTARKELRAEAAVPFPAAGGGNGSLNDTVTAGGGGAVTHRTRTRTRGGPK